MYILDTNVLSELRAGKAKASERVLAWAGGVQSRQMYLSVISLLELERGILLAERRAPVQAARLRLWLQGVREIFADRILPVDAEAALACAPMHVPDPASLADSLIAATALTRGFTVVTRNGVDFRRLGVKVLDPWQA